MNIPHLLRNTFSTLLLFTIALGISAQQAPTSSVSRDQALASVQLFQADPINNLNAAPTFLKFIETDGEVHIVLNPRLTAWMYEDYEPEARAVLYAAYMGGNMRAQLDGRAFGDDPVAGMVGVLDAYRALAPKYPDLAIPLLESLKESREVGELQAAVSAITQP